MSDIDKTTQQLRELIELAIDRGYTPPWDGEWENLDCVVIDTHKDPWWVEQILFGGNLSFLKALVGTGHCCHICGTANQDRHASRCTAAGLSYANRTYWMATRLVVMDDSKRIPYLYNTLFEEDR